MKKNKLYQQSSPEGLLCKKHNKKKLLPKSVYRYIILTRWICMATKKSDNETRTNCEEKLKKFQKENRNLIKANQHFVRENKLLKEQKNTLEKAISTFEEVFELSRKELQDKSEIINAMEMTNELSISEKAQLQETVNAYKGLSEMSTNELADANQIIQAHEEIERLSWEERRVIDSELLLAQKIQFGLMSHKWPKVPGLNIATKYQPADRLGGDLYSLNSPAEKRYSIFISDVAGHGTQAALITMIVKTLVENLIVQHPDPAELLLKINSQLYQIIKDLKTFVTAAMLVFDLESNKAFYANGGHTKLIYKKSNGSISEIQATGSILGAFNEMHYETEIINLEPDDLFLFYTDGIIEASNDNDEEFGINRLLESVKKIKQTETSEKAA